MFVFSCYFFKQNAILWVPCQISGIFLFGLIALDIPPPNHCNMSAWCCLKRMAHTNPLGTWGSSAESCPSLSSSTRHSAASEALNAEAEECHRKRTTSPETQPATTAPAAMSIATWMWTSSRIAILYHGFLLLYYKWPIGSIPDWGIHICDMILWGIFPFLHHYITIYRWFPHIPVPFIHLFLVNFIPCISIMTGYDWFQITIFLANPTWLMLRSLGEDSPAENAGQASMPSKVPGWIRTTHASHLGSFIPNEGGNIEK